MKLNKIVSTNKNFLETDIDIETLNRSERSALDRLISRASEKKLRGNKSRLRRGKSKQSCDYQGKNYKHMALFKPTSCDICECDDGVVECESIQCEILHCAVQTVPDGACCPICDESAAAAYLPNNPTEGM